MPSKGPNINPWIDPKDEARLLAVLTGEASDFERAAVERLMEAKPELRAFHRRMEDFHELLVSAMKSELSEVEVEKWRLSRERRHALLTTFGKDSRRSSSRPIAILRRMSQILVTAGAAAAVLLIVGMTFRMLVNQVSVDRASGEISFATGVSAGDGDDDLSRTREPSIRLGAAENLGWSDMSGLRRSPSAPSEPAFGENDNRKTEKMPLLAQSEPEALADMETSTAGKVESLVANRGEKRHFQSTEFLAEWGADDDWFLPANGRAAGAGGSAKDGDQRDEYAKLGDANITGFGIISRGGVATGPDDALAANFRQSDEKLSQIETSETGIQPVARAEPESGLRRDVRFKERSAEGDRAAPLAAPSEEVAEVPAWESDSALVEARDEPEKPTLPSLEKADSPVREKEMLERESELRSDGGERPSSLTAAPAPAPQPDPSQGIQEQQQGQSPDLASYARKEFEQQNLDQPGRRGERNDPILDPLRKTTEGLNRLDSEAAAKLTPAEIADQAPSDEAKTKDLADLETRVDEARLRSLDLAERYRNTDLGSVINRSSAANDKAAAGKPTATELNVHGRPRVSAWPLIVENDARQTPYSTFSLHVSDVSFKLAKAALLDQGTQPEAAKMRVEEFVNAFEYGDPVPSYEEQVSCQVEQAAHPFRQQRNLLRVSMRTAALGRSQSQPLHITLLLDNSGSMEREDRKASVQRAAALLAAQLTPRDRVNLIGFARTAQLRVEALSGDRAVELVEEVARIPVEGGTNLEVALQLAGELARRHYTVEGQNRIVIMTDGAANLGDADPTRLKLLTNELRSEGIAVDACGVGANGLNDEMLEALTREADGRYYFLDRPEDADGSFVQQLAGALRPAAKNVKVQVRFNEKRVGKYRLLGFEKHRLKKEDFRDDAVDAAELAGAEAGVAVYEVEVKPEGKGPVGEVFVRYREVASGEMVEKRWEMPYEKDVKALEEAPSTMQLAGVAAFLGQKLKGEEEADALRLEELTGVLTDLQQAYGGNERVADLIAMVRKLQ